MFNLHVVKTGRMDAQRSKFYARLANYRHDSDYEDFVFFTDKDVLPLLAETEQFIAEIRLLIQ